MSTPIAEKNELFCTHIGGAAVPEGVMMRGRHCWAVAIRTPNGGIYLEEHTIKDPPVKGSWKAWPILRGCVALVQSLELSYKAMGIASEHAYEPEAEVKGPVDTGKAGEPAAGCVPAEEPAEYGNATMVGAIFTGLLLAIALFVVLPVVIANLVVGAYVVDNAAVWNLVETIVRIAVLVGYIAGIGFIPDIRRLYGYHGAEHESIHCLEHGGELTPATCATFSRLQVLKAGGHAELGHMGVDDLCPVSVKVA